LDPRACLGDGARVDAGDRALWRPTGGAEVERRVGVLSEARGVDADRLFEWVRAFAPCRAVAEANRGHVGTEEFDALMELAEGAAVTR
ncbi:aminoglycoside resistance protein, partial [Nocardiopsis tropica]|nr:aminoglycoside resistance protein [Nocardiopsis tropica]